MRLNHYPRRNVKIKGFDCKISPRISLEYSPKIRKYCMERYLRCVVSAELSFRDFEHCMKYRNGISWSNYGWIFVA